jgi:(R)-2-hydroxyacyl-CoA dehydratese activating ATPase
LIYAGLDVGSRTIKLVTLDEGRQDSLVVETGVSPLRRCQALMVGKNFAKLVVTGYGRHLAAPVLKGEVISEIKAFSIGARSVLPECHTVIDIGGQDAKVIRLSEKGDVHKFEMNDRCAAGTGKFLEIMAGTLEVNISQIGALALSATRAVQINSLCTVFAESEVVSLIAKGEDSSAIAMALHEAISTRIAGMVSRIGLQEKAVFAGGASLNICLRHLLEEKLGTDLFVPENPQTLGALGAAILAKQMAEL